MIEVIISGDCPHCAEQKKIMEQMRPGEYRIIQYESSDFDSYPDKAIVDTVPFVIVRDANGRIRMAKCGVFSAEELRGINDGPATTPFNLRRNRLSSS